MGRSGRRARSNRPGTRPFIALFLSLARPQWGISKEFSNVHNLIKIGAGWLGEPVLIRNRSVGLIDAYSPNPGPWR